MKEGIRKIFSEVPHSYELVNHILTFGLDIFWRRKVAKIAASGGGTMWMDICSGTGEMAFYLSRLAPERTQVFAVDFALPMVDQALKKKDAHKIFFILSDINALPFPDKTFDVVTISFAARNTNLNREGLLQSLQEIKRILKPNGRFLSLETSQPTSSLIRKLFHIYVRLAVKPIGQIISGSKSAYSYLSHTIQRFYSAEEFAEILLQAGFAQVTFERMLFGVTTVHTAVK